MLPLKPLLWLVLLLAVAVAPRADTAAVFAAASYGHSLHQLNHRHSPPQVNLGSPRFEPDFEYQAQPHKDDQHYFYHAQDFLAFGQPAEPLPPQAIPAEPADKWATSASPAVAEIETVGVGSDDDDDDEQGTGIDIEALRRDINKHLHQLNVPLSPKEAHLLHADVVDNAPRPSTTTKDTPHIHVPHGSPAVDTDASPTAEMHRAHDNGEEVDLLLTWFTVHDTDMNGALDGMELLAAFSEWDNQEQQVLTTQGHQHRQPQHLINARAVLASMVQMVDHVLDEDDADGDGMISVDEYLQSNHH